MPDGTAERPGTQPTERELRNAIRARLARCAPGATACPSEVARALRTEGWRELMAPVRAVAARLAEAGELEFTSSGAVVDPAAARGPVRLRPTPRLGPPEHR
ncbi:S-adenosylmethionine tRNA ribosyltransferase [Amycolatopsis antarctica]|uniref:S-adenosylmethionine tRNA ribosyltransferase n=1 Tax=Amycolatopsis antarctica TaxID=1854586 RepID=A0A263CVR5_9PSEU|nr:DUF3253 domain-containing protein [Amycolatopsis antarctica]OZM70068.1 S-adenosylmethionine tRNA ribosyltransferase [Amycolatopsis antarctica]